jgi:hypothetical protein
LTSLPSVSLANLSGAAAGIDAGGATEGAMLAEVLPVAGFVAVLDGAGDMVVAGAAGGMAVDAVLGVAGVLAGAAGSCLPQALSNSRPARLALHSVVMRRACDMVNSWVDDVADTDPWGDAAAPSLGAVDTRRLARRR